MSALPRDWFLRGPGAAPREKRELTDAEASELAAQLYASVLLAEQPLGDLLFGAGFSGKEP